ncbi:hypothetical protein AVEN_46687-1 [Araneus ventricosus]|uniref:Uncharacterized protein n=1 Tax=Araneus ventricosus TaxID=182803 RepID=A0A4Y2R1L2_ARAVE|nr:hypothetical protein AVEN_46687-1 [Araneus ventricosus]
MEVGFNFTRYVRRMMNTIQPIVTAIQITYLRRAGSVPQRAILFDTPDQDRQKRIGVRERVTASGSTFARLGDGTSPCQRAQPLKASISPARKGAIRTK